MSEIIEVAATLRQWLRGGGQVYTAIARFSSLRRRALRSGYRPILQGASAAAVVAGLGLVSLSYPEESVAQQAARPKTNPAYGALPAATPHPDSANNLMFSSELMGGAASAAPGLSAFAPLEAPDVMATTSDLAATLNAAKRRSQDGASPRAESASANRAAVEAVEKVSSKPSAPKVSGGKISARVEPLMAKAETSAAPAQSRISAREAPVLAQAETDTSAAPVGIETAAFTTRTSIVVNNSKNLTVALPFTKAIVGDPSVAEVVPVSNRKLNIVGRKIGSTNVMLYDQEARVLGVVYVNVQLDTGAMAAELRQGSGQRGIRVNEVNGNIVLSGEVADGLAADRAMRVASGMAPEGRNVVNNLSVSTPQQVMLQVRFVEADRQAVRNIGVRWNAFWSNGKSGGVIGQNAGTFTRIGGPAGTSTLVADAVSGSVNGLASTASPFATILANLVNSKSGSLDVVLSALEESQVLRRIAEPNLVALSGESADFLAGGEFPVPVSSTTGVGGAPTVTIDYKQFGVRLKFTPTVLANGVVSLKLNSEVSDLDPSVLVQTGGVAVPGISMRRASSTVQLRDGQAFAIAGMLSAKSQRQLDAFPWLGTLPVIGALFSSKQFVNNESELVMLVSPHLVKPLPPNAKIKTPLSARLPGNDIDMFLKQELEVPKSQPTYVTRSGQSQTLDSGLAPGAPEFHWPWEDPK